MLLMYSEWGNKMIAVLQRVSRASVSVDGEVLGKIDKGYMILLGVIEGDTKEHLEKLCEKIVNLRIFSDDQGKMNLSIKDVNGEILLISQFTLAADCKKGRRPSFIKSAHPDYANQLYEEMATVIRTEGINCEMGRFGADMQVELVNDGPVTIILDTKELM